MADNKLAQLTADIVSNYVGANEVTPDQIPQLIHTTHAALLRAASGADDPSAMPAKLTPAVSIKKSVTPAFLISLEDGRKYKSLKRHLRTAYNMSPEEYRAKWNLPDDYPMVAPLYSASRSALAKSMGLGRGKLQQKAEPAKAAPRKPRGKSTAKDSGA